MSRIVVITDMDSVGSGYKHICIPLLTGLAKLGHDIKVCGLMYKGEEHYHPFSILQAQNVQEAVGMAQNLVYLWQPDIVLVALDLPLQAQIHRDVAPLLARTPQEVQAGLTKPRKYIAITPLENGPLTMSWAAPLFNMDAIFFISELGKQEALKVGVTKAEHLIVGIDTESWHPVTPEQKKQLREGLGIPQDAFVVLTVADNQERKNLWAGMAALSLLTHDGMTIQDILNGQVSRFSKTMTNSKYILVTREQSPYGWRLRDLAVSLDINKEYMPFERGLPQKDLWALYAVADVYLQPSKAEGLGLPVMDAMACGVPVVATDTGAMHELLDDARGWLIPAEYEFIDVWGNSKRSMIDVEVTKTTLATISSSDEKWIELEKTNIQKALEFMKNKTWDIPVQQVHTKIEELLK